MIDYSKEKFLNNIYQDLHMKEEVINSSRLSDTKYEKIRKYLCRLENNLLLAKNNKYTNYLYTNDYIMKNNRINKISEILKENINYSKLNEVLTKIENIVCEINY